MYLQSTQTVEISATADYVSKKNENSKKLKM